MWRNIMGKKKKAEKFEQKLWNILEAECVDDMECDAGQLLHTMYNIADKVRVVSHTSDKMNELSEYLDDVVSHLVTMRPEEIQIIQRLL